MIFMIVIKTKPFLCFTVGYQLEQSEGGGFSYPVKAYNRFNPLVIFLRIFGSCFRSCDILDDFIINSKVVYCKRSDVLALINRYVEHKYLPEYPWRLRETSKDLLGFIGLAANLPRV